MSRNVLSQNETQKGHKVKYYMKYHIPTVLDEGAQTVLVLPLVPVSYILYDI